MLQCMLMKDCDEFFVSGEEDEEEDIEAMGPFPQPDEHPEVSTLKKVEVEIQERRDTKPGVPHVREWDRGKGRPSSLKVCNKPQNLSHQAMNAIMVLVSKCFASL